VSDEPAESIEVPFGVSAKSSRWNCNDTKRKDELNRRRVLRMAKHQALLVSVVL